MDLTPILSGYQSVSSTISTPDNLAYIALSKPAWVIGVGIMLFLCFEGLGGPVQWLLSRPFFGYVSKLTFATTYLLHPTVLAILFWNRTETMHYSVVNFSINFTATLSMTAVLAFLVHLSVEQPVANLEAQLMKRLLPANASGAVRKGRGRSTSLLTGARPLSAGSDDESDEASAGKKQTSNGLWCRL